MVKPMSMPLHKSTLKDKVVDSTKKTKLTPRKKPTQSRGRSTVDFIIEATKKIIINEGYEHATTNHIAEVTGVSVGSLYQYFPNKEAIVLALIEETVSLAANRVRTRLRELMDVPLEEAMHEVIRMLLNTYKENEFILLRLLHKIPELEEYTQQLAVEKFTHSTNLAFLQQHEHEISVSDLDTALLIIENSIISNINTFIEDNPTNLTEEQFISEMVKLACNYLK